MPVVAEILRNSAREHRERLALVDTSDASKYTYLQMDSYFNRVANALAALGLRPGDHVGVLQRNSPHWIACEGGIAKAGMVTIPLNTYSSPRELAWVLRHSEARAVIFSAEEAPQVGAVRDEVPDCRVFAYLAKQGRDAPSWAIDLADVVGTASDRDPGRDIDPMQPHRIMYTSATTGVPKGVICPNQVWCDSILTMLANQLRDVTEQDRFLAATPLTHMAIGFFWPFFVRGGATVTMRRFDVAQACELIARYEISHLVLVPTMLIMLINYLKQDERAMRCLRSGSLRALFYGGSPIPPTVIRDAERMFGPILNQQYGLTELLSTHPSMAVTHLSPRWHSEKIASCGRPLIGTVIRVVDDHGAAVPPGEVGEIVVRAHEAGGGYWKQPDGELGAFQKGWIHTGDVGWVDEDGFLYIKDRKNDMIITGGLNVYPAEVESVLHEHPSVSQCAVVGVPDSKWIEVPWAVVVRNPGHSASEVELIEFVRSRLAHYKAPKRVVFRDELPVSPIGKVLRRSLREQLSKALGEKPKGA